ncbi:MAG TPA: glycoside hydrolase family 2 TIM barrel-domain containing protein [Verrucomicrobiae bacterium]|jgi:beta-galactosidase
MKPAGKLEIEHAPDWLARRLNVFWHYLPALMLVALGMVILTPPALAREDINLNDGWHFTRLENQTNISSANPPEVGSAFDDAKWETVFLPHTPRIESPDGVQNYFQGVSWYRRQIVPQPAWRGKKVSLRFEGAMQVADVWVNGQHRLTHLGGYLPFSVDITDALTQPGGATVAVCLDNTDHPDVPPGKNHDQLDFSYFGGLYRNVHLVITDPLHVTDPIAANRVAGGGIFVRTEFISSNTAAIFAQVDVLNEGENETNAAVRFTVLGPDEKTVTRAAVKFSTLAAGDERATNHLFSIENPKLWYPDHPWLYTLKTEILRHDKVVDVISTRFGIRTVAGDDKLGFVLNGKPLVIRGANRHQDFPWLGNAVADNAAYRDLKRLKDAGFNFLRLAHYPQSSAVMDACDELGLMVSVCTPGWQHFSRDGQFTQLARQNIREMVRWHRNHPSAVMWEVSLNETYGHDSFYADCARIAREEFPGGQMLVSGDSYASKDVSHFDFPYAGWADFYQRPAAPGFESSKRSFAREYGDYEFGGEHSTTRVARGAGEDALLLQAWNFQWSHNRNASFPWLCGDAIWEGVDNQRGCSRENPIARCGVLDYLRLPKFSYYFFQSQRAENAPMVFIANYWTPRSSPAKVVIFSNCEEVELFLNGKSLGRRRPDAGPDTDYGVWHPEADLVYMAKGKTVSDDEKESADDLKTPHAAELRSMFDGGNCRHIDHAPFTFAPVNFAAGELKAVGYIRGKAVTEDRRHTPGKPARLQLTAELEGRPLAADGADAIFIRATICDADGNPVPDADNPVTCNVAGAAQLVSPAIVPAEAGVATMLICSHSLSSGSVLVRATALGLQSAEIKLNAISVK